jgi:hypothetical protein
MPPREPRLRHPASALRILSCLMLSRLSGLAAAPARDRLQPPRLGPAATCGPTSAMLAASRRIEGKIVRPAFCRGR